MNSPGARPSRAARRMAAVTSGTRGAYAQARTAERHIARAPADDAPQLGNLAWHGGDGRATRRRRQA